MVFVRATVNMSCLLAGNVFLHITEALDELGLVVSLKVSLLQNTNTNYTYTQLEDALVVDLLSPKLHIKSSPESICHCPFQIVHVIAF